MKKNELSLPKPTGLPRILAQCLLAAVLWGIPSSLWAVWIPIPTPYGDHLNAVHFPVSDQVGFVAADAGFMFRTTNGGASWTYIGYAGASLNGIHFINNNTGFAVGNGGLITKITNASGGPTISPATPGSNQLMAVHFPNPALPVNSQIGYAVGGGGNFLRTTDGGANWSELNTTGATVKLYDVFFYNDGNGIHTDDIGYTVGASGTILRTEDGGATWENQGPGGLFSFYSIAMLTDKQAIAVGDGGMIYRTSNGKTWSPVASPTGDDLNAVDFSAGGGIGYAVGGKGTIIQTGDGGSTWSLSPQSGVITKKDLQGLSVVAPGTFAYAVGKGGDTIKLIDGNAAVSLTKQAFDQGGTWIPHGIRLPKGTRIKFMVYLFSDQSATNDVRFVDVLDPAFGYVPGTLRVGTMNTSSFGGVPLTPAEETTLFANATTVVGDAINSTDVAGISGATIEVGLPGNAVLNVGNNRVWALTYEVVLQ
ncbi:hypothetical protein DESUT3_28920 [Desulfuromonas versatilis]|uniref:Photosynthesis system II assembly factor Ycf48/Hcf136-like domain-containing protein n=1 Tax=Desulfuromonas versatilis TaxID=2802975 RepID=A0ABM8HV77_9BACT|nr:hypothetical protein [Desulfuromonas versatilis]BCR05823.1 hypothetical protein DESUT3_28920 [Desulfuromonas versatilis]